MTPSSQSPITLKHTHLHTLFHLICTIVRADSACFCRCNLTCQVCLTLLNFFFTWKLCYVARVGAETNVACKCVQTPYLKLQVGILSTVAQHWEQHCSITRVYINTDFCISLRSSQCGAPASPPPPAVLHLSHECEWQMWLSCRHQFPPTLKTAGSETSVNRFQIASRTLWRSLYFLKIFSRLSQKAQRIICANVCVAPAAIVVEAHWLRLFSCSPPGLIVCCGDTGSLDSMALALCLGNALGACFLAFFFLAWRSIVVICFLQPHPTPFMEFTTRLFISERREEDNGVALSNNRPIKHYK